LSFFFILNIICDFLIYSLTKLFCSRSTLPLYKSTISKKEILVLKKGDDFVFVSHFKKVTPTIYKNYESMFLTNKSQVDHRLEEWFSQLFFSFEKRWCTLFFSHFKKQMTIKEEFLMVIRQRIWIKISFANTKVQKGL
jgi:hypothetical protein